MDSLTPPPKLSSTELLLILKKNEHWCRKIFIKYSCHSFYTPGTVKIRIGVDFNEAVGSLFDKKKNIESLIIGVALCYYVISFKYANRHRFNVAIEK